MNGLSRRDLLRASGAALACECQRCKAKLRNERQSRLHSLENSAFRTGDA